MLQECSRVLILGSMTRIGIHNQLCVWQVLGQDQRIDRRNDNVFIPVNDQCWLRDVFQCGVTACFWDGSPFSDGGKLRDGRVPRHRAVPIFLARFEPVNVLATSRLASVGSSEERA